MVGQTLTEGSFYLKFCLDIFGKCFVCSKTFGNLLIQFCQVAMFCLEKTCASCAMSGKSCRMRDSKLGRKVSMGTRSFFEYSLPVTAQAAFLDFAFGAGEFGGAR